MAQGRKIPKGAKLIASKDGIVQTTGERGRIALYEGMYSDGYKSDFEQVLQRFFYLETCGNRWTFRYSGRNFDEAQRQYDDCADEIVSDAFQVVA